MGGITCGEALIYYMVSLRLQPGVNWIWTDLQFQNLWNIGNSSSFPGFAAIVEADTRI